MVLGISSEWDDISLDPPQRVRRRVDTLTDKELYFFVAAVHEVQRAVSGAENDLYGIFGWGQDEDQQAARNGKINNARRRLAQAQDAMKALQEFI